MTEQTTAGPSPFEEVGNNKGRGPARTDRATHHHRLPRLGGERGRMSIAIPEPSGLMQFGQQGPYAAESLAYRKLEPVRHLQAINLRSLRGVPRTIGR